MCKYINRRGFTLIELLVVVSIVALLSSSIFASLATARIKARDAQRIANAGEIVKALEVYGIDSGSYVLPSSGHVTTHALGEGTGFVTKKGTDADSDSSTYQAQSIISALKSKGVYSSDNLIDPVFGKDNYYLAICTASSSYGVYLNLEQSLLRISPSALATQCGGGTAVGLGMNYVVSANGAGIVPQSGASSGFAWSGSKFVAAPPTPSGGVVGTMTTYGVTGSRSEGIAFDGVNMWTASYLNNSVSKITPSGVVTTPTGTGWSPQSIAFDGVNMWAGSNPVTKITPNGVGSNYWGTGGDPTDIAFDGTYMWTADWAGNSVTKIASSGAMTIYPIGVSPHGIAFDGTNMWTANMNQDSVTKISSTGATTTYTGTGSGPRYIAFDGANMWTVNYTGNSVTKISSDGTMTTYPGTGASPYGIAFDGKNMWTANYGDNSVTKISSDGTMTTYPGTGAGPRAIAYDGTNMWTANYDASSVTKIIAR